MRSHLHYLLLDGFDPDTGELALRVGAFEEESREAQVLRPSAYGDVQARVGRIEAALDRMVNAAVAPAV